VSAERIKFLSIVSDFDLERAFHQRKSDDLVCQRVFVSVFDIVGNDLLCGKIGDENHNGGCLLALKKSRRRVSGNG
jgi:hypothetical protein